MEILGSFADDDLKVPIKKVGEFVKLLEELTESKEDKENQAFRKLLNFFDENGDGKLSKTEAKMFSVELCPRSKTACCLSASDLSPLLTEASRFSLMWLRSLST